MLPHVEAVFKFAKVFRQVFLRNPDVRPADRPLQDQPKGFEIVNVIDPAHILFRPVFDRSVAVTHIRDRPVGHPFVGADMGTWGNVRPDMREQVTPAGGLDNAGNDLAFALHHAEHDGLLCAAPGQTLLLPANGTPADIGFVQFDNAVQRAVAINLGHVLADFVAHTPRGFVGHAQLALQFLRRYAMPRRCEKIHGIEPFLERRVGARERRADHRMNVVAAAWAGIRGHLAQAVKFPDFAAFLAFDAIAKADLPKVLKTGIVGRELAEEIGNGECHGLVS